MSDALFIATMIMILAGFAGAIFSEERFSKFFWNVIILIGLAILVWSTCKMFASIL